MTLKMNLKHRIKCNLVARPTTYFLIMEVLLLDAKLIYRGEHLSSYSVE